MMMELTEREIGSDNGNFVMNIIKEVTEAIEAVTVKVVFQGQ